MKAQQITLQFIQDVLKKFFPHNLDHAIILPFDNTLDFGDGGFASLYNYQVFDENQRLLFVVKAEEITAENYKFISLLVPACELLNKLPLKHSKLILPFHVEAYETDALIFQCVALPAAKGKSLSALISACTKGAFSGEALLEASEQTALALSEMNGLLLSNAKEVSLSQQEEEDKIAGIFALYQEENPEWFPFNLPEFHKGFTAALVNAHSAPFPIGIIHGDSNITNIFYSSQSPHIQLIDSLCVFQSITPQGNPIGNISQEYARTLCSLELMGHYYGMDESKMTEILKTFSENYSIAIPSRQFHYYSLLFWMAYTIICHKVSQRKAFTPSLSHLQKFILQKVKSLL